MPPTARFSPIAQLASLLAAAALSNDAEIYSVEALSELAGLSRRAFQNRCQAAGVTGRDCLHFVQCLKAILVAEGDHWDPAALIPVGDPRTLRKILTQAGMNGTERPTITAFVFDQQFCNSSWFKESVLTALDHRPDSPHTAL